MGFATLAAAVAVAVLFRAQVAHVAKRFAALYVDGPLKVQLPVIGATAALGTYLLLKGISKLPRCNFSSEPLLLRTPGALDDIQST